MNVQDRLSAPARRLAVPAAAVVLAAALTLPLRDAHAAGTAAPVDFSGACSFSGPIQPNPPITLVPRPGPSFSYYGTGACTGTLGGASVSQAPITVTFTDATTLFDTCELGPDFALHGDATIGSRLQRAAFAIRVDLARALVAGPFLLRTTDRGTAVGVAQFSPASPTAAPAQCATTGVGAASLSGSFNTVSPLVGTAAPEQP